MNIKSSFIFLFLLFWANIFAQNYTFRTYSVPEGLPLGYIMNISQDHDGFIWAGTMLGVSRFDGLKFTNYTTKDGLPTNNITASHVDKRGVLWLGHDNGKISVYNSSLNRFEVRDVLDAKAAISKIRPGIKDGLYFVTRGDGVYYLNNDSLVHLSEKNGIRNPICHDVLAHENGKLWVTTPNGLFEFEDVLSETPRLVRKMDTHNGFTRSNLTSMLKTADGTIWVGQQGAGIARFLGWDQPSGIYFQVYNRESGIQGDWVLDMCQAYDGTIWVGHYNHGLVKINQRPTAKNTYQFESIMEETGLPHERVSCVFQGREGNMWFGTLGVGLIQFRDESFFTYDTSDGLVDDHVLSMVEDADNDIWVGSRFGITKIPGDPKTGAVLSFKRHGQIKLENIFAAYQDVDGILWFSAYGRALVRYDKTQGKMETIQAGDGLPSPHIRHIHGDGDSLLFLTTSSSGLVTYNRYRKTYKVYDNWPDSKKARIYDIHACESGNLWMATNKGLFLFDRKKIIPSWISDSLKGRIFKKVDQESNGILWLLMEDGKLVRIEHGKIQIIKPHDDLERNVITSFLIDHRDQVWVETSRSIGKFNYETGEFKLLNKLAGFPVEQVNIRTLCDDNHGRIWVGSRNGLICYDESKKRPRLVPPGIRISNLQVFLKDFPLRKNLTLEHRQNHLTFYYAALTFTLPEFVSYRYMLDGFDAQWLPETRENFATYSNLPPGSYNFMVQTRQRGEEWSATYASFNLRIKTPFWKSNWFYLFIFILLISGIYGFIRLRQYQMERDKIRLQNMVDERTEELRQEKERLSIIFENMDEAVIFANARGEILFFNDAAEALTGFENQEVNGRSLKSVLKLYDIATDQPVSGVFENISSHQAADHYLKDYLLHSRDDRKRIVSYSGSYLRDNHKNITGSVFVLRDETEKRKLEQEFLKAQKIESIGVLAGGIAHDFNNILTGILGNISMARLKSGNDAELDKRLNDAEKASVRARDLTQQLLTFSKGGAPVKQTTSVVSIIEDSANFVMSGSAIQCALSFSEDLWPVEIDSGQISQVVQNLLLNAEQAMPSGGKISVTAANIFFDRENLYGFSGKFVKIVVKDEGVGIAREHLGQIFDPYFTTKQRGNGLGLATSYSIVKKHGGTMEVQSEMGVGTEVGFFLPAADVEPKKRPGAAKSKMWKDSGRILVMDDEAVVRDIAVEMLGHFGFTVDTAVNGHEFLSKYREALSENQPYKLSILDLTVPGSMGGKEAMAELLKMDSSALAIVSSGYSSDPVMAEHQKYGFAGVVSKPYSVKALSQALRAVLSPE